MNVSNLYAGTLSSECMRVRVRVCWCVCVRAEIDKKQNNPEEEIVCEEERSVASLRESERGRGRKCACVREQMENKT